MNSKGAYCIHSYRDAYCSIFRVIIVVLSRFRWFTLFLLRPLIGFAYLTSVRNLGHTLVLEF